MSTTRDRCGPYQITRAWPVMLPNDPDDDWRDLVSEEAEEAL